MRCAFLIIHQCMFVQSVDKLSLDHEYYRYGHPYTAPIKAHQSRVEKNVDRVEQQLLNDLVLK